MTLTVTWIRNNMLHFDDKYERQPSEAELKVQRSLQKLSIPDWYFNKRSNPPKLTNVTRIAYRPSPWKNSTHRMESVRLNTTSFSSLDTSVDQKAKKEAARIAKRDTKTYCQQKSPDAKLKRSAPTSSAKDEVFDTSIPLVKLPKNVSKTFPKRSPCRKIQNINLVFPPDPRIEFSKDLEDNECNEDDMDKSFVVKKQSVDANASTDNTSIDYEITMESKRKEQDILELEIMPISPRTPRVETSFHIRAASTPKFSPANLFSSSIIEETPKMKKIPSKNILDKSSLFENMSGSTNLADNTTNEFESSSWSRRRMSQSVLQKTFIFEASSKEENNSLNCKKSPLKAKKINWALEENIRSFDPVMFEKTDVNSSLPRSSSMVRDIVKKIEVSKKPVCHVEGKESTITIDEKISNFDKKVLNFVSEERKSQSPFSKFLNSKRKSMELENVVKSKQPQREKSLVRGIIETLMEKMRKPRLPRENIDVGVNQNFVKQLVRALEKEDTTEVENSLSERTSVSEEGSFIESETKASITSASLEDTDSTSDSDLRSPSPKNDDDLKFTYVNLATKKMDIEQKILQDDDSVYWIPVVRCTLPRSSSLLSMMSRLSANAQSSCVSPIRSESEVEDAQPTSWGTTLKKTDISSNLFRIDETVIIDSGYSDRSDRSVGSPTNFGFARSKRSCRRKSIVGHTICVH